MFRLKACPYSFVLTKLAIAMSGFRLGNAHRQMEILEAMVSGATNCLSYLSYGTTAMQAKTLISVWEMLKL